MVCARYAMGCDLWPAAWPRCTRVAMLRKGAKAHHLAACPRSCVSDMSGPALTCISMLACARCLLVARTMPPLCDFQCAAWPRCAAQPCCEGAQQYTAE